MERLPDDENRFERHEYQTKTNQYTPLQHQNLENSLLENFMEDSQEEGMYFSLL